MTADALDHPLEQFAWWAESQRKLVQRLGIATLRELLQHYPRRYEDRTRFAAFPTLAAIQLAIRPFARLGF